MGFSVLELSFVLLETLHCCRFRAICPLNVAIPMKLALLEFSFVMVNSFVWIFELSFTLKRSLNERAFVRKASFVFFQKTLAVSFVVLDFACICLLCSRQ